MLTVTPKAGQSWAEAVPSRAATPRTISSTVTVPPRSQSPTQAGVTAEVEAGDGVRPTTSGGDGVAVASVVADDVALRDSDGVGDGVEAGEGVSTGVAVSVAPGF